MLCKNNNKKIYYNKKKINLNEKNIFKVKFIIINNYKKIKKFFKKINKKCLKIIINQKIFPIQMIIYQLLLKLMNNLSNKLIMIKIIIKKKNKN